MNTNSKVVITAVSPLATLLSMGIPGLNIIAPLILWLVWKDEDPELNAAGKVILNSQISWFIWLVIAFAIGIPLSFILIGIVIIVVMFLLWLIFTIMQAVKMSNGNYSYKMPMTISFLK